MKPRHSHGLLRDKKVIPCSFEDYLADAKNPEDFESHRRVAKTEIHSGLFVSTVFLGIDHGWGDAPMWFETMVFVDSQSTLSLEAANAWSEFQTRYATWDEAQAGHDEVVARLKEGLLPNG